jgi:hypothetical protein
MTLEVIKYIRFSHPALTDAAAATDMLSLKVTNIYPNVYRSIST